MAPVAVASAPRSRRSNRAKPEAAAVAASQVRARAEARLGRADQSRQGEDHHGEGRQRADRRAGPAGRPDPAGRPGARALRADAPPAVAAGSRPGILGTLPAEPAQPAAVYQTAAATSAPVTTESVGSAAAASARALDHPGRRVSQGNGSEGSPARAQSLAKSMLAKADPFTERFVKGNQEYYRARFAGFDQHGAEAACKYFKRNEIACLAIRN